MRLDKYLWAVRLYKTRPLAAEACQNGRVRMASDGRELKPSHDVKPGERFLLNIDQLHKEVEALALPPGRVGAALVPAFMADLTPREEYERIDMARRYAYERRDRGEGRPTKRDRRDLERFKESR